MFENLLDPVSSENAVNGKVGTPNPAIQKPNDAMALAASLIDHSGTGPEATRDELATLVVDKPNKTQFFRIHPGLHGDVNLLKTEGICGKETFAVLPHIARSLDNVSLYTLFFGVH